MKLDFVCIGAQKAGTTTLHDVLKQHPDVFLPDAKEAQFVDVNEFYYEGVEKYWKKHFYNYNNEKLIGNINPNLLNTTRSIDRLVETFGKEIKVLFILRNPIDRAYSHYLMSKSRGIENQDFLIACELEKERLNNPKTYNNHKSKEIGHYENDHFTYIKRGYYSEQIEYIYKVFNKENVKILFFDDLITNKIVFFNEIFDFLGLTKNVKIDFNLKSNEAHQSRLSFLNQFIRKESKFKKSILNILFPKKVKQNLKMSLLKLNSKKLNKEDKKLNIEDRKKVYNLYFQDEITKLEKILSRDLSHWKI